MLLKNKINGNTEMYKTALKLTTLPKLIMTGNIKVGQCIDFIGFGL